MFYYFASQNLKTRYSFEFAIDRSGSLVDNTYIQSFLYYYDWKSFLGYIQSFITGGSIFRTQSNAHF